MPTRWKSKPGAKRRLADEYDGAQERREVRAPNERTASGREAVGVKDIGLTHKQIHEARAVRDAENNDPGMVRRTLDSLQQRDGSNEQITASWGNAAFYSSLIRCHRAWALARPAQSVPLRSVCTS